MSRDDLAHAPPATAELGAFAAGLRFEQLPSAVVEHTKSCVLDALGCALYGNTPSWTQLVADMAIMEQAQGKARI